MLPTRLRGARTHNLRGVDVEIRPYEVTVLTGVSGSGKSSLALDTLYAEGQRRFVESFSPYARQFLERLERPPMDALDPVAAGVAVDRSGSVKGSRSTVATMADLEPYLAGLFAKESVPHCPEHHLPAVEMTLARATDLVQERFQGQRLTITAPQLVGDGAEYLGVREDLLRQGYTRVLVDGQLTELDALKPSVAEKAGRLYVVLDRLQVDAGSKSRVREALELSFRRSAGLVTPGHSYLFAGAEPLHLRQGLSCPTCARGFPPPAAGFFSYTSPLGACDNCRGFGRILGIDLQKVIPNDELSLGGGAIRPWRGDSAVWERKQLHKFCEAEGIPLDIAWAELPAAARQKIWDGTGKRGKDRYWGIGEWFGWLLSKAYKMHVRVLLSRYRSYDPCPVCQGTRLHESSRWYKLEGLDLGEWHALELDEGLRRAKGLRLLTPHGRLLRAELASRLSYLSRVGLGYLTLDRQARTLSGGEAQRVSLTAALGTSLHSALFVLDEPTVGLHPADIGPLCELVHELAERGNAVLVIEHEPLVLAQADRIIELGPAAGDGGGQITFDGSVSEAIKRGGTTARALRGPIARQRPPPTDGGALEIRGARAHNLKDVFVSVPLGQLVALCGPSGSGKSTLAVDVLYLAVARHLKVADVERPGEHESILGLGALSHVELVDQSPLGRTSRGNPATYTKAWDAIRKAFAAEPQAQALGFSASHFSFNVAGGRCETCSGEGYETVEMQFLADVSLTCPVCQGCRFKDEILEVRHLGKSIADVLALTVDGALSLFEAVPALRRALGPLAALGLGYLRLGQPLSTLSGGEAQRLKLARALTERRPHTLYVLDEPSAGLHSDEIELLVQALVALVTSGGSVVFVDHDLSLIAAADHVLELGPGGGAGGGALIFTGTPMQLKAQTTPTGRALRAAQAKRPAGPRKATAAPGQAELVVKGAREHTLRNIDVRVPHQQLTVITGPSGSGKSTLAFDVIFAEGQRRFLETLTPYARQFLPTLPRPSVDSVQGVPPSIALEQRTARIGSRSTVATVTEVAHYLRLFYAKLGTFYCPEHDAEIGQSTAEEVLALIQRRAGEGALLAPLVRGRKGTYLEVFGSLSKAGFGWAVADGRRVSVEAPPRLAKTREHDIDLLFRDKVRFAELELPTLQEALRWGKGKVNVEADGETTQFSTVGACPSCGFSVGDVDPRFFSFNTRQGQCAHCEGSGSEPAPARRGRAAEVKAAPCSVCAGARLSPFSKKARLFGLTYPELTRLSVSELSVRAEEWTFSGRSARIAEPILPELRRRLAFLAEVGLEYLTLDRDARTLSGGEIQRLRLAAQLGSGLTGALYILDEPTIGLHPEDTGRLIDNLRKLVKTGSTVVMVEHDEDVIRAADHLIDLGPAGGRHGGQVMATGAPADVLLNPASPTAVAFRGQHRARVALEVPERHPMLVLDGARENNLVGDLLRVPLGRMTVIAGVSGSGKSTLIARVLLPAVAEKLGRVTVKPGAYRKLSGCEALVRAVAVDQSPIGRTPRSVPATFLGIFDYIRKLFARCPDAQVRGFDASRFSFNTPGGGRCTTCEGQGVESHEMSFLPDVVTTCPACEGLRFEERTLEVRYLERNIGEVLALSAEDACLLFAAHPKIIAPLTVLRDLGAGYITLGQGSHTLSGGEAQRLKLAAELSAGSRHEATLYVLDEPTTGLHVSDVHRLVGVLDRLVQRGDTLVVVEHQPDLIAVADWVVELGPGAGPRGGRIVHMGAPRGLIGAQTATGRVLSQRARRPEAPTGKAGAEWPPSKLLE